MQTYQNILISKLKQRHKVGIDPLKDKNFSSTDWQDLTSALQKYQDAQDVLVNSMPTINALMKDMGEVMGGVVTESAKLSEGFQRAQNYQQSYNKQVLSLIKGVTGLEESSAQLNKEIGMSSLKSLDFARDLRKLGVEMKVGDKVSFAAAVSIGKFTAGYNAAVDSTNTFNQSLQKGQIYLT